MKTRNFVTAATLAAALFAGTGAFAESTSPAPASNETVNYVAQLPSPSELSGLPAPAGAHISKITQTAGEITVTYVFDGGQTRVVTYRLLSSAGAPAAPAATAPASPAPGGAAVVAQPSSPAPVYYYDAPPSVVYQTAPVYYDSPYYYYPWYPPVAISLGFGFHGGGYYGGFRGFHGGFHR